MKLASLILRLTSAFIFLLSTNGISQSQNNYDVNIGNGGLRFWNGNDRFKVHMGTGTYYRFGPVQDYSKTNMDGAPNRGFTWGSTGRIPIAGLDINGNFEIAGDFVSKNATASSSISLSPTTFN